jgi:hypothetical protein
MQGRNCDARATAHAHEFRQVGGAPSGKSDGRGSIVSEN